MFFSVSNTWWKDTDKLDYPVVIFCLVFNRTRKRKVRDLFFELIERVRTEELSGSNLHKLSKSSYQKRTKIFFYSLPISYQNEIEKSIVSN